MVSVPGLGVFASSSMTGPDGGTAHAPLRGHPALDERRSVREGAMTRRFLRDMRPYLRQVAGQLTLGSLAGIVMNTAVVLPAILLGRAIDAALAFERGHARAADVGWAARGFFGGTLVPEGPRLGARWWLVTAEAAMRPDGG